MKCILLLLLPFSAMAQQPLRITAGKGPAYETTPVILPAAKEPPGFRIHSPGKTAVYYIDGRAYYPYRRQSMKARYPYLFSTYTEKDFKHIPLMVFLQQLPST